MKANLMHATVFCRAHFRWSWPGIPLCTYCLFLALAFCGLPLNAAERPNVLLICVDDLRPELKCYGVNYIHSPNIDQLAARGRLFTRHYVQAPTCGASRCALLTGRYGGASNGALFQRAEQIAAGQTVSPSLPAWFRAQGYTTVSVGKVSHHPGGRGGPDWNDPNLLEMPGSWDRHLLPAGPWEHPRGWMHGLANGEIRVNAKNMDVLQSVVGNDSIYPDGISTTEALHQIEQLAGDQSNPFFLAFGILRPHLPFGAPARYLKPYQDVELPPIPHPERPANRSTWHASGEFMKYNRWGRDPNEDADFANKVRKHYAACVSFADAQVGKVVDKLKEKGLWENTLIVLWGDHGWHLGEHAIWGKHALFEESLRSPLVIAHADMSRAGEVSHAVVESIDIFPTLCELAGIEQPTFVQGTSLVPWLNQPEKPGHPAVSYFRSASTIRTEQYRMILHNDGFAELYDHEMDPGETINLADKLPEVVERLSQLLIERRASS